MIEHLSLSSVKAYLSCPRLFRYKYVKKVPELKSPWAIFGTAVHRTIEEYVSAVANEPWRKDDCPSMQSRWPYHWKAAQKKEPNIDWSRADSDALLADGTRIFTVRETLRFVRDDLRAAVVKGEPLIETFFKFDLPDVGVPIIGYIDIVADDGVPGDFKTSKQAWTTEKAARELQPLVYLMGLQSLGVNIDGRFRHYVIPSNGYKPLQVIESHHSARRVTQMVEIIQNVWHSIEEERFHRNPTYQWCGKYCPYVEQCQP